MLGFWGRFSWKNSTWIGNHWRTFCFDENDLKLMNKERSGCWCVLLCQSGSKCSVILWGWRPRMPQITLHYFNFDRHRIHRIESNRIPNSSSGNRFGIRSNSIRWPSNRIGKS
jgi:hypothetical protein